MGRPKSIRSAEELANKIDDYIAYNKSLNVDNKVVIPTDYDFCKYFSISSQTLWCYWNDKDTYKGYSDALKKLVDYREQFLLNLAVNNSKAATVAIFALKQQKNGGYVDHPVIDIAAKELTIKTAGIGDKAFD